ncbi:hypothetical protein [Acinetobacter baumannii]|uniref:hypothetical protein n=1 Tax=Acinetobacter baumannii TaxID=470 RepID=UPI0010581492|nr:hypothetical protein [Acinetobacter baumannii]MDC4422677.1 hypothetical protein [Acinetobacter baumannii]MDC4567454.1 hypothetical protein [Acinetobacter baumannii]MDC4743032.1 hypothetical protein [Acinetobacter baumannii]MDC4854806.1 hypothetical protein [Acinetobacter baumannii]MDC4955844.1 hypothetical protein [Acinetobacter baumannii]
MQNLHKELFSVLQTGSNKRMQYSNGLMIEPLENGFLLIINNKNLFDFLWEKFAKDFGHERLMQNVTVNTTDYRIYIQGLKPHVLEQDLKFISPDFLNQYV